MKLQVLIISLVLLLPSALLAQSKEDDVARYRTLTSEAADAFVDGDFRKTIALLSEARSIHDHPDLTYNMGRAYEAMGWCGRAREAFTIYSKRKDIKRKDRDAVTKRMEALSTCEEVREVQIVCSPPEARLRIDAMPEVGCDALFELKNGAHTIEVFAAGYAPAVLSVSITEFSDDIKLNASLTPLVVPADAVDVIAEPVLPPEESVIPVVGWALVGGGVLAFAAGLVLDATAAPDAVDPYNVDSINDDAAMRRNLTLGLYIGGAALTATGGGLLIWHYTTSSSDEVSLHATPTGARFQVRF